MSRNGLMPFWKYPIQLWWYWSLSLRPKLIRDDRSEPLKSRNRYLLFMFQNDVFFRLGSDSARHDWSVHYPKPFQSEAGRVLIHKRSQSMTFDEVISEPKTSRVTTPAPNSRGHEGNGGDESQVSRQFCYHNRPCLDQVPQFEHNCGTNTFQKFHLKRSASSIRSRNITGAAH